MANINQITVDGNIYDIEDKTARQESSGKLPLNGGTMAGDIDMASHKITGLPAPTSESEAVNRGYVDAQTRYWTLIDSVTLTDEVAQYIKDLPAETYHELYVTATAKLGGTISNNLVRFFVQDYTRVCGIDVKCSAGNTMYVAAHLVTLPGKGHAGIIGVGVEPYINATTSMSPGILDSEEQGGYIRQCCIAVMPAYDATATATLAAGTKIMIWGR